MTHAKATIISYGIGHLKASAKTDFRRRDEERNPPDRLLPTKPSPGLASVRRDRVSDRGPLLCFGDKAGFQKPRCRVRQAPQILAVVLPGPFAGTNLLDLRRHRQDFLGVICFSKIPKAHQNAPEGRRGSRATQRVMLEGWPPALLA